MQLASSRIVPANHGMLNECRLDTVDQQNKWFHVGTNEKLTDKEAAWMFDYEGIDLRHTCQIGDMYGYIDDSGMVPRPGSMQTGLLRLVLVSYLFADIAVLMIGLFTFLKFKDSPNGKRRILWSIISAVVFISIIAGVGFIEQKIYMGRVCFGISCPINIHIDRFF